MKHRFMALLASAALSLSCLTPVHAGAADSLPGDLNCDRQISSADAVLLCRLLAEDADDLLTKQGIQNADYNYDGMIDMADQRALLSYIKNPDRPYTLSVYAPQYTARPGGTIDFGIYVYDNPGYYSAVLSLQTDRALQVITNKSGEPVMQYGVNQLKSTGQSVSEITNDVFSVAVFDSNLLSDNGMICSFQIRIPADAKPHSVYPVDINAAEFKALDPESGYYKLKTVRINGGIKVLPSAESRTETSAGSVTQPVTTASAPKTTTVTAPVTSASTSTTQQTITTSTTASATVPIKATTTPPVHTEPAGPAYTQVDSLQIAPYPFIVRRNEEVTLHVIGIPNTEYDINVYYSSGASKATGLENYVSDSAGHVSWTWKIGGKTNSGNYSIDLIGGNVKTKIQFSVVD